MQLSTQLTETVTEQVRHLVDQLSPRVTSDTDLLRSGILDSLNLVKLLTAIEATFGLRISLDDVDINAFRNITSIAGLVHDRTTATYMGPPNGTAPAPAPDASSAAPVLPWPEADPHLRAREALADEVVNIFRTEFAFEIAEPGQDLFQSGALDSMSLVQLILRIESTFGLNLPMQSVDIASFRTVLSIVDLVYDAKFGTR